jgi:hypothetical protein
VVHRRQEHHDPQKKKSKENENFTVQSLTDNLVRKDFRTRLSRLNEINRRSVRFVILIARNLARHGQRYNGDNTKKRAFHSLRKGLFQ